MTEAHSKPAGRAIITYSRGWQTLVATRSLGLRGVEVITADEYPMTPASFSRFSVDRFEYPNVTNEPERFLDVLEENVVKHKPGDGRPYVLMPIHKETYLIARNRERFEPHITVPLPRIEDIERVHNKGTLAAMAMDSGLSVPETWLPETRDEFETMAESIPLPAFVKLRESAAGVGVQKVKTLEELEATFHEFVDHFRLKDRNLPIIQQAVPGEDYCVTTLFDHGKLLACMTYHNLRAFPAEKGAGVLRETVDAPAMEQVAKDLLGPMGWHGVAQLDFRWDGTPEGRPYLIEVNPRFWGGLIQAVESGWDYPWMLYSLAAHGKVEAVEDGRYDVRTETPFLAFLATLQDIAENSHGMTALSEACKAGQKEFLEGSKRAGIKNFLRDARAAVSFTTRLKDAQAMLKVHEDNIYDVLSRNDPLPALGVLYPLAVFLRHGKVNMELITGESGPSPDDD